VRWLIPVRALPLIALYDCTLTAFTRSINIWNVENVLEDGESSKFPNCNREPLCSNAICDTSLSAKERAEGLISLWTIDEKLANMIDEAAGAPRLGINRYNWWSEGLHGLADRGVEFDAPGSGEWDAATSFPQPILFAAAFDDDLVTRIGDVIGTETRAFNADGRVGLNLYVSKRPIFTPVALLRVQEYELTLRHRLPISIISKTLAGAAAKRPPVKIPSTPRATRALSLPVSSARSMGTRESWSPASITRATTLRTLAQWTDTTLMLGSVRRI
jgi:hypothetical protein